VGEPTTASVRGPAVALRAGAPAPVIAAAVADAAAVAEALAVAAAAAAAAAAAVADAEALVGGRGGRPDADELSGDAPGTPPATSVVAAAEVCGATGGDAAVTPTEAAVEGDSWRPAATPKLPLPGGVMSTVPPGCVGVDPAPELADWLLVEVVNSGRGGCHPEDGGCGWGSDGDAPDEADPSEAGVDASWLL